MFGEIYPATSDSDSGREERRALKSAQVMHAAIIFSISSQSQCLHGSMVFPCSHNIFFGREQQCPHNGCDFRMDPDLDDFRKCPKSIQQMHWGLRKPLQFPPGLTSLLTHSTSSSPMRSCRILVRCSCRTTSKSGKKSKPLDARSARSGVLGFRTCGKRYAVI